MGLKRKKLKIVFVGEGWVPMYEIGLYNAAKKMHDLEPYLFTWNEQIANLRTTLLGRVKNKLVIGRVISNINKKMIEYCKENKPDIVFLYACRIIEEKTIKELKKICGYVAIYNNDDPFSSFYPKYFWRCWRRSIKYSDIVYVYRDNNIDDCIKYGGRNVKKLRSYYNEERIYYIPDEENTIDCCVPDVLFLGHYESDERAEYIKYLADNGIGIGIPNIMEWRGFEKDNPNVIKLENTHTVYNQLINKAKICLVFLSKINNDTYTRRCFEIPAVKTLMMSVYTDDIASLFESDKEIVFFRNKEELLNKIKYYLSNPNELLQISEAGFERVMRDGHSSIDRVKEILVDYRVTKRGN